MRLSIFRTLIVFFIVGLLGACSPGEQALEALNANVEVGAKADSRDNGTNTESDLSFVYETRPGDIILVNDSAERGCWYLNTLQNLALNPRYCHAALVVAHLYGDRITTIEAQPRTNIQVLRDREISLGKYTATKLAVLRVVDDQGQPLSEQDIENVIDQALQWKDVRYAEPPIPLDGDPYKTGLYCSLLPYRAYLDAAGIDLDTQREGTIETMPFVVTPDELYYAKNVRVVFESAPHDPPLAAHQENGAPSTGIDPDHN